MDAGWGRRLARHRWVVVATVLASSCGRPPPGLVVANGPDVEVLDPQQATAVSDLRILSSLFEGLTRLDPRTLEPVPGLAASFLAENGARRWLFRLRPGLRFSDGSPLQAEDVILSWRRILDPSQASPYRDWFRDLETLEAPSADEIRVAFRRPRPAFAELCAHPALAPLPAAHRALPPGELPVLLVGTGPFRLEFRRVRDRVRVEADPWYWNRAAVRLPAVDFLTVESQFTALNLFLAGEVDLVASDPPALAVPALLEREERRAAAARRAGLPPPEPEFAPSPYWGTYFYRFNTTRPPLDDPRVRRALVLAVDREALARALGAGRAPAWTFVPPLDRRAAPPRGFDLARARELLAEAGYPGGRDLPPIEILYNSAELHRDVAETLQDQWQRGLGLRVRLYNQEWKVVLAAQRALDYQVVRSSWVGDWMDPLAFLEIFLPGHPANRTGWNDEEYAALIEEARDTADPRDRAVILHRAEERLLDQAPILPLFHDATLELVSRRLRGHIRNPRAWIDWSRLELLAAREGGQ